MVQNTIWEKSSKYTTDMKTIQWANEVLGVGELITVDDIKVNARNTLKFYLDPTNGKTYADGGRGTSTNPFSHIDDVLEIIEKYNIEKLIEIDGQGYEYNCNRVYIFYDYDVINLYDIQFNINFDFYTVANDSFAAVFLGINHCTFDLGNLTFKLNHIQHDGLSIGEDTLIQFDSGVGAIKNSFKVITVDDSYYVSRLFRVQGCLLKISGYLNVEAYNETNPTPSNSPVKEIMYLLDGANIIVSHNNTSNGTFINSTNCYVRDYYLRIENSKISIDLDKIYSANFGIGKYILGGDFIIENRVGQTVSDIIKNEMSKTFYVDAVNGDDTTGDGSEDHPFKTIKKAVDSVPSGGEGYINVVSDYTLNNNISLKNKNIRIMFDSIDRVFIINNYTDNSYLYYYGFYLSKTAFSISNCTLQLANKIDSTLNYNGQALSSVFKGNHPGGPNFVRLGGVNLKIPADAGIFCTSGIGNWSILTHLAIENSSITIDGGKLYVIQGNGFKMGVGSISVGSNIVPKNSNGDIVRWVDIIEGIVYKKDGYTVANLLTNIDLYHPSLTDSEYKQLTLKNMTYMNKVLDVGELSGDTLTVYFDPTGLTYSNGGRGTTANPFSNLNDFLGLCDEYNCKLIDKKLVLDGQNKTWTYNSVNIHLFTGFKTTDVWDDDFRFALKIQNFNFEINADYAAAYAHLFRFGNMQAQVLLTNNTLTCLNGNNIEWVIMFVACTTYFDINDFTINRPDNTYGWISKYFVVADKGSIGIVRSITTNDNGTDRAVNYLVYSRYGSNVKLGYNVGAHPVYGAYVSNHGKVVILDNANNYDTALYTKEVDTGAIVFNKDGQLLP